MMRPAGRRVLAVLAMVVPALLAPLHAQVSDSSYANRRMARLAARLRADASLPDSIRQLSIRDMVDPTNTSYFRLLDDSTSSLFLRLAAASLHQVPDSVCGAILGPNAGPSRGFADMLPHLDSATVDAWALLLARVLRARAAGGPDFPRATSSQVNAATMAFLERLDPADRERLSDIARHPPPSQRDACWSMQALMDGLASIPPTALGPVVRAMFAPDPAGDAKTP